MEVLVDKVVNDSRDEHEVDEWRDERKKNLEDQNIGQRKQPHSAPVDDSSAVFEDGLQNAKGPTKALPCQTIGIDGSLREGERLIFVDDCVPLLEQIHGEVSVFGNRIGMIAAAGLDCSGSPGTDSPRNDH